MLRNSIRRSSTNAATKSSSSSSSAIPFQPVPINKYNQTRSSFNFKPATKKSDNLQGLIHNPPSSIFKPTKTPHAFLPPNDPRRKFSNTAKVYTKEELNNYPIIHNYQAAGNRDYSITPETIREIQTLRQQDPQQWTISKLSAKFGISPHRVNVFTGTLDHDLRKKDDYAGLNPVQIKRLQDRKKRVQLWLRSEF